MTRIAQFNLKDSNQEKLIEGEYYQIVVDSNVYHTSDYTWKLHNMIVEYLGDVNRNEWLPYWFRIILGEIKGDSGRGYTTGKTKGDIIRLHGNEVLKLVKL